MNVHIRFRANRMNRKRKERLWTAKAKAATATKKGTKRTPRSSCAFHRKTHGKVSELCVVGKTRWLFLLRTHRHRTQFFLVYSPISNHLVPFHINPCVFPFGGESSSAKEVVVVVVVSSCRWCCVLSVYPSIVLGGLNIRIHIIVYIYIHRRGHLAWIKLGIKFAVLDWIALSWIAPVDWRRSLHLYADNSRVRSVDYTFSFFLCCVRVRWYCVYI